jgi:hypothetical protein
MTQESKLVPPPQIDLMSRPVYTCPELGRNPGITDDRFVAFGLPSRIGPWLYYPDGRKEMIDG